MLETVIGISTDSSCWVKKIVEAGAPLTVAIDPLTKLLPTTVMVTGSSPATTPGGEIDVTIGSVVVKGKPLTRAPGENKLVPPEAVECITNGPEMSGLRVID